MRDPFTPQHSVFAYQERVLPVLLAWGAGSVVLGVRWWRGESLWWRGVGMQCAAWGAIDAVIALAGLRGARKNAAALASGTLTDTAHAEEARKFERVLWLNTGLDVGYIVGGTLWTRRTPAQSLGSGAGAGVIAQGLFLLVFDLLNSVVVRTRRTATLREITPPQAKTPKTALL